MSVLVSEELHKTAKDLREAANGLREEAEKMLEDDNALNDLFANDLLQQAGEMDLAAGLAEGLAAAVEWLGF